MLKSFVILNICMFFRRIVCIRQKKEKKRKKILFIYNKDNNDRTYMYAY
jgi:hypothetical protein